MKGLAKRIGVVLVGLWWLAALVSVIAHWPDGLAGPIAIGATAMGLFLVARRGRGLPRISAGPGPRWTAHRRERSTDEIK